MSADPLKTDPLQLAQQYLLGELSGPEIEAFEKRLADDATLAEALADVVLLHGSLTGATTRAMPERSQKTKRRINQFWWGAAAVAVVGAVALSQLPLPGSKGTVVRSDLLNVDRPEIYDALFAREDDDPAPVDLVDIDMDDAALDVPDWMVAALEAAGQGIQEPGQPQEEEL